MGRVVAVLSVLGLVLVAAGPAQAAKAGAAQAAQPCASNLPSALTGDQLAVAQDSAAKAAEARSKLPANATVVCSTALKVLPVPQGVQLTASPLHQVGQSSGKVARAAQSGGGQLGTIACSISGNVYYVSTPTYIHVQVWWSCNAYYNSMSGGVVCQTPSSGTFIHGMSDSNNWSGYKYTEFTSVAWYGYHNRAVWEYGDFAFTGVGILPVTTTTSLI